MTTERMIMALLALAIMGGVLILCGFGNRGKKKPKPRKPYLTGPLDQPPMPLYQEGRYGRY